ncbi:homeobox-leucine zipper protein HAT22-like [Mangifera indica]|uniref:homeobox-leucine zipper protein HAT22-like n=1 Tax=Mangifera indica TaxID=29780 RepID=UPI001CFBE85E|nr:homeobox-leucine zipper protein HAT22-like [Mangifera indica]
MGFEDICNTGLRLGIYRLPQTHQQQQKKKKKKTLFLKYDHLLPSLSLGPSQDILNSAAKNYAAGKVCESTCVHQQTSSLSALSSFSNSSVKEERDFAEEEVELERNFISRVSDEDEEVSPRKKLRLTKAQFATLEESFKEHITLNPKQKQALAEKLNLRPRQVEVWFQNRRARTKLKQTEVDCEFLKKCCESLTEENKRLQKELQELKSLTVSASVCMQLPAATLTMCPSCEKVSGGGGGDGSSTSPLSFRSNPRFYDSLISNPSAASC